MLANGLAKQVQVMHYEHGHTPEQIAESLKIELGLVAHALMRAPDSIKTSKSKTLLAKYAERAAEVLGEQLDDYGNARIQHEAARFILEVEMGKHDMPEKTVGKQGDVNQFNVILMQANSAYDEQLKKAGVLTDDGKPNTQQPNKEPIEV